MRYYTKLSYANGKNIWIACSNKTNSYLTEKDIQSFDTWEEAENHIKELKKKDAATKEATQQ